MSYYTIPCNRVRQAYRMAIRGFGGPLADHWLKYRKRLKHRGTEDTERSRGEGRRGEQRAGEGQGKGRGRGRAGEGEGEGEGEGQGKGKGMGRGRAGEGEGEGQGKGREWGHSFGGLWCAGKPLCSCASNGTNHAKYSLAM